MSDNETIELAEATDLEVRFLFSSILSEFRKRKMDFSLTHFLSGEDFSLIVSITDERNEVNVKWLHDMDELDDLADGGVEAFDNELDDSLVDEDFELIASDSTKLNVPRSAIDMPWFKKERVDESEDSEDEEEDIDASDDGVDYSLQDESEDFYDDDDWIYDEPMSGRTPNDDRSDSMNPNSNSYNPGK